MTFSPLRPALRARDPAGRCQVWRRPVPLLAAVLLAFGLWQTAAGGWIHAKGWLAQVLLERAWQETLANGGAIRPWPWADTWPVARIRMPRLGIDQIVLAGVSGQAMAFGPGHVGASAAPGEPGNTVLGGHRDTHFAWLADLVPGDRVLVEDRSGVINVHEVTTIRVVINGEAGIPLDTFRPRLTLTTCWPFDAVVPGGPERYVVTAERRES